MADSGTPDNTQSAMEISNDNNDSCDSDLFPAGDMFGPNNTDKSSKRELMDTGEDDVNVVDKLKNTEGSGFQGDSSPDRQVAEGSWKRLLRTKWNTLHFLCGDKTHDVTKYISAQKLQYVLTSGIAKAELIKKVDLVHDMEVYSPEVVRVTFKSSSCLRIEGYVSLLVAQINSYLQNIKEADVSFKSLNAMEIIFKNLVQTNSELLEVCVCTEIKDNTVYAKLTGKEEVISLLKQYIDENKDVSMIKLSTDEINLGSLGPNINALIPEIKRYSTSIWIIRGLQKLSMISELQKAFPDVCIEVKDETTVTFQAFSKKHIADAIKELKVYESRLHIVPIPESRQGIEILLEKKTVQSTLKKILGVENIVLVKDEMGNGRIVCLAVNLKRKNLDGNFSSFNIDTKFLENRRVKMFINEHSDEIYVYSSNQTTYICCLAELKSKLEECLVCSKRKCNRAVACYVRTHGVDLIHSFECQFCQTIEVHDDWIYCYGKLDESERCMNAIEDHLAISVVHVGNCQLGLSPDDAHTEMSVNAICDMAKVGCSVTPVLMEPQIETSGIQYYCKWPLSEDRLQVAVGDVDYNLLNELYAVIVPVDDCMSGENIFDDNKFCSYVQTSNRQNLGVWRTSDCLKSKRDIVAVVVHDTVVEQKTVEETVMESCCREVFRSLSAYKRSRICFSFGTNASAFKKQIYPIVKAFSNEYRNKYSNNYELLFSVKGDPVGTVQDIDHILRTFGAKRLTSSSIEGIFTKPSVSVSVIRETLLSVKACAYTMAVSAELDLSKGLTKEVSDRAGPDFQTEVQSRKKTLHAGEVASFHSYRLITVGVKKLFFGYLPAWADCKDTKALEAIIEECLLKAENSGCSSVAFPAMGTGKLKYPQRDVAVAIFDGIQRYTDVTMKGDIQNVFIAVPTTDKDNFEILESEKQRRMLDVVPAAIKGEPYIECTYKKVNCKLVKDTSVRTFCCKKHYVEVCLIPPLDPHNMRVFDIYPQKMIVSCGKSCGRSVGDLEQRMFDILLHCESNKITRITVNFAGYFGFSSFEGIDAVVAAIKNSESARTVGYLQEIIIIVDERLFNEFAVKKLIQPTESKYSFPFYSFINSTIQWKKEFLPGKKMSTNIVLAGENKDNVLRAKKKIEHLLTSQPVLETETVGIVSAEINLGIIDYLKAAPDNVYAKWTTSVKDAFNIEIAEDHAKNTVVVIGTLESVLKFEDYLETDFPSAPIVGKNPVVHEKSFVDNDYFND